MGIFFLRDLQIAQHANGVFDGASGYKSPCRLHQITWPNQMISTQVFIPFVKSPWNGQAGDGAAQEIFRFVRAQHRHAGAVEVAIAFQIIQLQESLVPAFPLSDVFPANIRVVFKKAGECVLSRL